MSKPPQNPRRALGRGLSSLLPARVPARVQPQQPATQADTGRSAQLPIDQIDPNPHQPRTTFPPDKLEELAASIKANGIIQPLVVRPHGDRYQLVAGERRWRAARLAGLNEVPVVIQNITDDRLLEITLVENIQREDLNPIEIAQAFDRLTRELNLNHDELARRTGKDRSTITNMIRLLRLPQDIQRLVAERRLSMGHARAILGLPNEELQRQVAEKASAQGYSVRQVERLVQRIMKPREPDTLEQALEDPNVRAAIQEMERTLGTRVRIVDRGDQRGKIEIEYYSAEDLQRIYGIIVATN